MYVSIYRFKQLAVPGASLFSNFSAAMHVRLKRYKHMYPGSFASWRTVTAVPLEVSNSVGGSSSHGAHFGSI